MCSKFHLLRIFLVILFHLSKNQREGRREFLLNSTPLESSFVFLYFFIRKIRGVVMRRSLRSPLRPRLRSPLPSSSLGRLRSPSSSPFEAFEAFVLTLRSLRSLQTFTPSLPLPLLPFDPSAAKASKPLRRKGTGSSLFCRRHQNSRKLLQISFQGKTLPSLSKTSQACPRYGAKAGTLTPRMPWL